MTEIDLHQHEKRIPDYLKERTRGQIILYEKTIIKNECAAVGLFTISKKRTFYSNKSC